MNTKEAARMIGISVEALQQLRFRKTGPKSSTDGWLVKYEESDVSEWMKTRKRRSVRMKKNR